MKAIEFSKRYTKFNDDKIELLIHTYQTVLCYYNRVWTKSSNKENFDIAMGSYHGAEVCDLVGLFILNEITFIIGPLNIGLHRDDALGVIIQSLGTIMERTKKRIIETILQIGFDIVIDNGNTTSNFLDISLNLTLNTYCPFTKPNSKTTYINNGSNHPKIIRKNIPLMIRNRNKVLIV